jgi:hypothetical protein
VEKYLSTMLVIRVFPQQAFLLLLFLFFSSVLIKNYVLSPDAKLVVESHLIGRL